MDLKEKIELDLKSAMKEKKELRLSTLRMLSSAMHNREIEKRTRLSSKITDGKELSEQSKLNEEEVIAVLRQEVKKRKDAIFEFGKGGREDLVEKETKELNMLEEYLPRELSEEDIGKIAGEIVAGLGPVSQKDFGRVMGEVMKQIKGQASGDRVSRVVKALLQ